MNSFATKLISSMFSATHITPVDESENTLELTWREKLFSSHQKVANYLLKKFASHQAFANMDYRILR